MCATRCYKQKGWTLLELSITLVLIIVLTTVMVYSIASGTNRQQAYQRVAANMNILVDAAHTWRQNHNSYRGISIAVLKDEGYLRQNWGTKTSSGTFHSGAKFSIESGKSANSTYSNTEKECPRGSYRCFTIKVENVNRPCAYLKHLAMTHPLHSEPSYDYSNPGTQCGNALPGRERLFRVTYD